MLFSPAPESLTRQLIFTCKGGRRRCHHLRVGLSRATAFSNARYFGYFWATAIDRRLVHGDAPGQSHCCAPMAAFRA